MAGGLFSPNSLWIAPAHSKEAFRCPARETVIDFSNGVKITATSGDGFWCSFTDQRGRPFWPFSIFSLQTLVDPKAIFKSKDGKSSKRPTPPVCENAPETNPPLGGKILPLLKI